MTPARPERFIPAFAKGYGLELVDYGHRRGLGLLVSSGSGTMMAIMDHAATLRWCLDIDGIKREGRLAGLLECAAHFPAVLVVFAGWFSITDPKPLFRSIDAAPENARARWHAYVPDLPFPVGHNHSTMEDLLSALQS